MSNVNYVYIVEDLNEDRIVGVFSTRKKAYDYVIYLFELYASQTKFIDENEKESEREWFIEDHLIGEFKVE